MRERAIYFLAIILGLFLTFLLWTQFSPILRINEWTPDLFCILTFLSAQIYGRRIGMFSGAYFGFLYDTSSELYGFALLAYSVSGFLAGQYFRFDRQYNYVNFIWGLLLMTLFHHFLYMGLYFYDQQPFATTLFKYIIPESLYTVVMGYLLYMITEKWIKQLYARS